MNGKRMFGTVTGKKSKKIYEVEILVFKQGLCEPYAIVLEKGSNGQLGLNYCTVNCIDNVRFENIKEN